MIIILIILIVSIISIIIFISTKKTNEIYKHSLQKISNTQKRKAPYKQVPKPKHKPKPQLAPKQKPQNWSKIMIQPKINCIILPSFILRRAGLLLILHRLQRITAQSHGSGWIRRQKTGFPSV